MIRFLLFLVAAVLFLLAGLISSLDVSGFESLTFIAFGLALLTVALAPAPPASPPA